MNEYLKTIRNVSLAAALSFGIAGQASAVAVFEVSPSAFGSANASFDANFINGGSSSILEITSLTTIAGHGWVDLTSYALNSISILGGVSGLGVDHQIWAEFAYTTTLVSGSIGAANSNYVVDSLSFDLFGAAGTGTTFVAADAQPLVILPSVTAGTMIGSGTLTSGVASFNALGGSAFNAITTFGLTAFGSTYFTAPVPFFDIAFNEFNNTSQGIERNGRFISINQASGGVDFNQAPEPGLLALFGIGLLGAISVSRAKKT